MKGKGAGLPDEGTGQRVPVWNTLPLRREK